ncbi:MAG: hypothetical protein IKZ28_05920 [Clostridia bacterium]|nr:hypothetical protein [Clostridia bacterium]
MKKTVFWALSPFLIFLFLLLPSHFSRRLTSTAFSAHPLSVQGEENLFPESGDYACILGDNAFFYSAPDERRGVFLLPKTYFVRLLTYGDTYCKIEYQRDESNAKRLIGYAKTEDLTFVDYVPARPFLYYCFDVCYEIGDTEYTDSDFLTQLTVTCVYYGDFRIGSGLYCYVLRGDDFGYIPKPNTLTYEENTEYADRLITEELPQTPPTTETPTEDSSSTPAQIAILIVVCLLVPVLAGLILKPPRRPPYAED